MHLIKYCVLIITVLYSTFGHADNTDPDCLNHLGGAFFGVECFNGLANDLREDNLRLFKKISSTIPKNNKSRYLLHKYMQNEKNRAIFCNLSKNSYLHWKTERPEKGSRYHDFDVEYYECIYSQVLEQSNFLKKLQENIAQ